MPLTKQQVGLLALQTLKVIEGNDVTPEPQDTIVIEQAYDNLYARLSSKDLVTWGISDSVPDEFVDSVVWLLANSRLTVFEPTPEDMQIISINAQSAEQEISSIIQPDYVPEELPGEYF